MREEGSRASKLTTMSSSGSRINSLLYASAAFVNGWNRGQVTRQHVQPFNAYAKQG